MNTRRSILGCALLALGLFSQSAAGAAGTVTISNTVRNGDLLTVTGTSTFTDTAFSTLGTDAAEDTFLPPQANLGGDLVAASMASRTNNQVLIRWTVAQLPPALDGAPTGMAYGFAFCVDGEDLCWEVDAQRAGIGAASTTPVGFLWRCATAACAPNAQTSARDDLPVTIDATAKTITATVNLSYIGATPGSVITPVAASPQGPAYVMAGDMTVYSVADFVDGILEVEPYTVAKKQVSAAVAAPGQDPDGLTYGTAVTPSTSGAFVTSTSVAGQSGSRTAYVRACFGQGNCAYANRDVAL